MDGAGMSGELYLCLHAREFPAQALLRLQPGLHANAIAVMDGEAPFEQVCSLNMRARKLGAAPGLSRAEMERFAGVTRMPRSLAEEEAARAALLACAGNFSPRIEYGCTATTFWCVLDIAGTETLFGPPSILATLVQQAIAELAVTCSLAVSTNYHAAVCIARGAVYARRPVIVPGGGEREALASLPISVLDIVTDHADTLAQWGVTSLGMLAALPEQDLIARLGQQGHRLRQLARGEHPHLFQPVELAPVLEEFIELDTPVELLDSLLFGASLMLERLLARAAARALALAALTTELSLEGGVVHVRTVRPALPAIDKQLWLKLLHLDWIAHSPQAPVISLRLKAETGETGRMQLGLFSPQLPEPGRLDVTLARIRAIVGEDRVGSAELKDTHEPDAFRIKPFSLVAAVPDRLLKAVKPVAVMRRLRPAETLTVTLRNSAPHRFYFRGAAYEAEKSYGPWRATGGWWTEDRWTLEEWDVVAHIKNHPPGLPTPSLLCCSMTHDTTNHCWQIKALYD
jgi:protein ImuB